MNLLLFLSALLSALTGVVGGGRVAEVPQYEALATAAVRVAASPVTLTTRPLDALPLLARVARAPLTQEVDLLPASPLYAGRRRE